MPTDAAANGIPTAGSPKFRIAIDPGHGGKDSGATGGGLIECDLVYTVAEALRQKLSADPHFYVTLTRTKTQTLSIFERTQKVKNQGADLMVSIHANSSPSPEARGTEVYVRNVLPPDLDSQYLASRENQNAGIEPNTPKSKVRWLSSKEDLKTILQDLQRQTALRLSAYFAEQVIQLWPRSRPKRERQMVRQAPFYVVSNVDIPAVLIEIGYLTNSADARWLSQPNTPEEIAESLFRSIITYSSTLTTRAAFR